MAAKLLTPSQCTLLHLYWPNDCCLCKANERIKKLEATARLRTKKLKTLGESMRKRQYGY